MVDGVKVSAEKISEVKDNLFFVFLSYFRINTKKLYSIQAKLESNCAADPELKDSAQRVGEYYFFSFMLCNVLYIES